MKVLGAGTPTHIKYIFKVLKKLLSILKHVKCDLDMKYYLLSFFSRLKSKCLLSILNGNPSD